MSFEENYLDELLKSVTNPEPEGTDNEEVNTLESIDIDGLDEAISSVTQTAIAAEFNPDETTLEDDMLALSDMFKNDNIPLDEIPLDEEEPALDEINLDAEEPTLEDVALDEENVVEEAALDDVALDEVALDETALDEVALDDVSLDNISLDDISLDDVALDDTALDNETDLEEDEEDDKPAISSSDSLEDILSMLDDDSELAEINDMLKKSDNNEPVADDMMSMLNQMADDEAKSVNEGVMDREAEDDDGGVPLPQYSATVAVDSDDDDDEDDDDEEDDDDDDDESDDFDDSFDDDSGDGPDEDTQSSSTETIQAVDENDGLDGLADFKGQNIADNAEVKEEAKKEEAKKEKPKKEKASKEKPQKTEKPKKEKTKKDKSKKDKGNAEPKEGSKLSKLFDLLTQDLVDEPTEEELAAEKAAKEAKKAENKTKKDEEKAKKDEEKKAKAEEKEAEKKAKAEEAAKKKKEKEEANKAKKEEKAAKKAAEAAANKGKKIPKKNIIAAAILGITVFGAIMIATNILSQQGYLRTARTAFYNQDYKSVYQATYGMKLKDDESDGLIKARSEVIMKMQRRYDSYQTNIKMGRELEALDALIQGLATYDYINADAEQYGVMSEVDEIKNEILNTLQAKYGLDETQARAIMNEEDNTAYTIDLNNVINGN